MILLASQRLQADLAGLTGAFGRLPTAARTTATEVLQQIVHGESGSLGYLFDHPAPTPVADHVPAPPPISPLGGYGHRGAAGQAVLHPAIGVTPTVPAVEAALRRWPAILQHPSEGPPA